MYVRQVQLIVVANSGESFMTYCPTQDSNLQIHENFSNNSFYSRHVENMQETRAEKILDWIAVRFETSPRKLLVAEQRVEFFFYRECELLKTRFIYILRNNCVSLYVHIGVGLRLFLNRQMYGIHAGEIGSALVLPRGKASFYFGRYGNTESTSNKYCPAESSMLFREVILHRVKSEVLCRISANIIIWLISCTEVPTFMPTCYTHPDTFLTPVQIRQHPCLFLRKTVQQLILKKVLFIFYIVSLVIIITKMLWPPL